MIQTWGDSYSGVGIKERFWLQWELESEPFLVNVNGGISVRIVWNWIVIVMSGILNRDGVWFQFHTFM